MKQQLYTEYAELTRLEKEIKAKKAEISEKIIADLQESPDRKLQTETGTFYLRTSPSYAYSEAVKSVEDKVKEMKKEERENGTAVVAENKTSLSFKS